MACRARHGPPPASPNCVAQAQRVLANATAFGIYDHNLVGVWERRNGAADAQWRIRPKTIVLATGAIERPLVFADNDRPGVMSADAALAYLRRHDVLVGERIVVATNNDSAYAVAAALQRAGANVTDRRHAEQFDGCVRLTGIELRRGVADRWRPRQSRRRGCDDRRRARRGRLPAGLRRLHADRASVLPGQGQAALRRAIGGLRSRRSGRWRQRRWRGQRHLRVVAAAGRGASGRWRNRRCAARVRA